MISINKNLNIKSVKKLFNFKKPNKTINNNILLESFKNKIYKVFYSEKQQFGFGNFYQSFDKFNIQGLRPTNYRIEKYNLKKYINQNTVILDIGSNTGFFDLSIADKVNSITGIEYNESLSVIANMTKNFLNVKNVNFVNRDFNKIKFTKKFDVIFSFAVHFWLGHSAENHSNIIYNLLNTDGIVVIESHSIKTGSDVDFDSKYIVDFCKDKFKVLEQGRIKDDNVIERSFYICRKI